MFNEGCPVKKQAGPRHITQCLQRTHKQSANVNKVPTDLCLITGQQQDNPQTNCTLGRGSQNAEGPGIDRVVVGLWLVELRKGLRKKLQGLAV